MSVPSTLMLIRGRTHGLQAGHNHHCRSKFTSRRTCSRARRAKGCNELKVVLSGKGVQTLPGLSHDIQQSYYELCIENTGRPAAAALAQMVRSTAIAFRAGHSMSKLRLEVEHGGFGEVNLTSASCRLTESDKQHRQNFLDTVYLTMQMLLLHSEGFDKGVKSAVTWQREWTEADSSILSIVDTVLTGQASGDELMSAKLDRALATGGASGGVASSCRTVAPQFIPISQLVLMTVKAAKELDAE